MIESFVLEWLSKYSFLRYISYVIFFIGFISLFSYPIYVTFLKIKFKKKKHDIYKSYLDNAPETYKRWLSYEVGGWLLNMSLPSSPIWFYKLVAKLSKTEVEEWRNGVKIAFGNDYKYYKWYLYITKANKFINLPILFVIIIDSIILN